MKSKDENLNSGRRDALRTIVGGAGGFAALPILGQKPASISPLQSAAAQANPAAADVSAAQWKPLFFDDHQNETIVALTDLIIPATDTPGAKAAQVNRYVDLLYSEQPAADQEKLIRGLGWLDGRSYSLRNKSFIELEPAEQTAILESIADPKNHNPQDLPGVELFQTMKWLTIFGYYTSEIGQVQELKYQGDRYNTSFPGACTNSH